jgi:hypothetical protein
MNTTNRRPITVGSCTYDVPKNIYRLRNKWRVSIERVDQATIRKNFPDDGSPCTSLQRATAWLSACEVRAPFTQIPLQRVAHRSLKLYRRTDRDGLPDTRNPSYSLRFEPSKSDWLRGWMTVFLGTKATMSQKRINEALGLLAARLQVYREESIRTSAQEAVDQQEYLFVAPLDVHSYRLLKRDILSWNGKGTHVAYSPKPVLLSHQLTKLSGG